MIWALHGFLGRGADWDFLREQFPNEQIRTPDFFAKSLEGQSLASWAEAFTSEVARCDSSPWLVGYSLGGRVALHALLAKPGLFRGAVIVSAGLGLEGEQVRVERRKRDEGWAKRFEIGDPWERVIEDWNAQELFGSTSKTEKPKLFFERREVDFDRRALAWALREWSPAQQEPLYARLHEIQGPVLWIAGERDTTYVREAERAVKQLLRAELKIVPGVGHRVPWEAPNDFLSSLSDVTEMK